MNAPTASNPEHEARQSWVHEEDPPSIEAVGDRAAPEGTADERHRLHDAEQAHVQADLVSEYTWYGTATSVICRPTSDIS
jgi:hypothetical protein